MYATYDLIYRRYSTEVENKVGVQLGGTWKREHYTYVKV